MDNTRSFLLPTKSPGITSVFIKPDDDDGETQGNATKPSPTESGTSDRTTNSMAREIRLLTSTDLNTRRDNGFIKSNPRQRVYPSLPVMSKEVEEEEKEGEEEGDVDEFYYNQKKRVMHILAGAGFGALMSLLIIVCIVCVVRLAASTMPLPKRASDPTAGDLEGVIGLDDVVIMDISSKTTDVKQTASVVSTPATNTTVDEEDGSKTRL
uniref:Uncharacterized protein n=1 Tax=Branchiostoma floridae TaxID=7739 RepID=C3Y2C1_BRAFL|eukprot:XP_002610001.1 hypothetical protein BRAFLDRAFT_105437 [Branchiostoma floridae]